MLETKSKTTSPRRQTKTSSATMLHSAKTRTVGYGGLSKEAKEMGIRQYSPAPPLHLHVHLKTKPLSRQWVEDVDKKLSKRRERRPSLIMEEEERNEPEAQRQQHADDVSERGQAARASTARSAKRVVGFQNVHDDHRDGKAAAGADGISRFKNHNANPRVPFSRHKVDESEAKRAQDLPGYWTTMGSGMNALPSMSAADKKRHDEEDFNATMEAKIAGRTKRMMDIPSKISGVDKEFGIPSEDSGIVRSVGYVAPDDKQARPATGPMPTPRLTRHALKQLAHQQKDVSAKVGDHEHDNDAPTFGDFKANRNVKVKPLQDDELEVAAKKRQMAIDQEAREPLFLLSDDQDDVGIKTGITVPVVKSNKHAGSTSQASPASSATSWSDEVSCGSSGAFSSRSNSPKRRKSQTDASDEVDELSNGKKYLRMRRKKSAASAALMRSKRGSNLSSQKPAMEAVNVHIAAKTKEIIANIGTNANLRIATPRPVTPPDEFDEKAEEAAVDGIIAAISKLNDGFDPTDEIALNQLQMKKDVEAQMKEERLLASIGSNKMNFESSTRSDGGSRSSSPALHTAGIGADGGNGVMLHHLYSSNRREIEDIISQLENSQRVLAEAEAADDAEWDDIQSGRRKERFEAEKKKEEEDAKAEEEHQKLSESQKDAEAATEAKKKWKLLNFMVKAKSSMGNKATQKSIALETEDDIRRKEEEEQWQSSKLKSVRSLRQMYDNNSYHAHFNKARSRRASHRTTTAAASEASGSQPYEELDDYNYYRQRARGQSPQRAGSMSSESEGLGRRRGSRRGSIADSIRDAMESMDQMDLEEQTNGKLDTQPSSPTLKHAPSMSEVVTQPFNRRGSAVPTKKLVLERHHIGGGKSNVQYTLLKDDNGQPHPVELWVRNDALEDHYVIIDLTNSPSVAATLYYGDEVEKRLRFLVEIPQGSEAHVCSMKPRGGRFKYDVKASLVHPDEVGYWKTKYLRKRISDEERSKYTNSRAVTPLTATSGSSSHTPVPHGSTLDVPGAASRRSSFSSITTPQDPSLGVQSHVLPEKRHSIRSSENNDDDDAADETMSDAMSEASTRSFARSRTGKRTKKGGTKGKKKKGTGLMRGDSSQSLLSIATGGPGPQSRSNSIFQFDSSLTPTRGQKGSNMDMRGLLSQRPSTSSSTPGTQTLNVVIDTSGTTPPSEGLLKSPGAPPADGIKHRQIASTPTGGRSGGGKKPLSRTNSKIYSSTTKQESSTAGGSVQRVRVTKSVVDKMSIPRGASRGSRKSHRSKTNPLSRSGEQHHRHHDGGELDDEEDLASVSNDEANETFLIQVTRPENEGSSVSMDIRPPSPTAVTREASAVDQELVCEEPAIDEELQRELERERREEEAAAQRRREEYLANERKKEAVRNGLMAELEESRRQSMLHPPPLHDGANDEEEEEDEEFEWGTIVEPLDATTATENLLEASRQHSDPRQGTESPASRSRSPSSRKLTKKLSSSHRKGGSKLSSKNSSRQTTPRGPSLSTPRDNSMKPPRMSSRESSKAATEVQEEQNFDEDDDEEDDVEDPEWGVADPDDQHKKGGNIFTSPIAEHDRVPSFTGKQRRSQDGEEQENINPIASKASFAHVSAAASANKRSVAQTKDSSPSPSPSNRRPPPAHLSPRGAAAPSAPQGLVTDGSNAANRDRDYVRALKRQAMSHVVKAAKTVAQLRKAQTAAPPKPKPSPPPASGARLPHQPSPLPQPPQEQPPVIIPTSVQDPVIDDVVDIAKAVLDSAAPNDTPPPSATAATVHGKTGSEQSEKKTKTRAIPFAAIARIIATHKATLEKAQEQIVSGEAEKENPSSKESPTNTDAAPQKLLTPAARGVAPREPSDAEEETRPTKEEQQLFQQDPVGYIAASSEVLRSIRDQVREQLAEDLKINAHQSNTATQRLSGPGDAKRGQPERDEKDQYRPSEDLQQYVVVLEGGRKVRASNSDKQHNTDRQLLMNRYGLVDEEVRAAELRRKEAERLEKELDALALVLDAVMDSYQQVNTQTARGEGSVPTSKQILALAYHIEQHRALNLGKLIHLVSMKTNDHGWTPRFGHEDEEIVYLDETSGQPIHQLPSARTVGRRASGAIVRPGHLAPSKPRQGSDASIGGFVLGGGSLLSNATGVIAPQPPRALNTKGSGASAALLRRKRKTMRVDRL